VLWSARDVSAGKRAEEERAARARKSQAEQRLEGLGALAGGTAHSFNNLLTTVLGFASLAAKDLPAGSRVQTYLKQIESAGQRGAALCQQMLAYAGRGGSFLGPTDVSAALREAADALHQAMPPGAVLSLWLASDLPPVLGDPKQLGQVALNLVANAGEALGAGGGNVVVATGRAHVDAAVRAGLRYGDLAEGEHVLLEVRDTGCGMDEVTLARAFEPFFSTKFTGLGLGLAAALGIVLSHRGAIRVTSAPGAGSTFSLLFPPAPAGGGEAPP
jgi:signal transduction histidine kinase